MGNTCTNEKDEMQDFSFGDKKAVKLTPEQIGQYNPGFLELDPAIDKVDPYDFLDPVDIGELSKKKRDKLPVGEGVLVTKYPNTGLSSTNFDGDEPIEPIMITESMNPYSDSAKERMNITPLSNFGVDPNLASNPTFGPYVYENGNTYEGQYREGLREGAGEETTPNGDLYIGQWMRDMKHGRGRMVLANGDFYEGEFYENKAHGNGTYTRGFGEDTTSYDGEFKNGEQYGYGVETYPGGACYKGDFVRNIKQGKGEFHFPDQTIYKGDFKDNLANGKGKFLYSDGRYYEGEFKDNLKHGHGTYKMNAKVVYTGQFFKGKKNGLGTITW